MNTTSLTANYTICTNYATSDQKSAYEVIKCIRHDTPPLQFDTVCQSQKEYQLIYSVKKWHALNRAAHLHNIVLIWHIIDIGGKELLGLGNEFGWTPLFCAIRGDSREDKNLAFWTVKAIVDLGADVNLATSYSHKNDDEILIPAKATPLWAAAELIKDLKTVRFLVKHGAVLNPTDISKTAERLISKAVGEKKWTERRLLWAGKIKNPNENCPLSNLPKELIKHIQSFI